MSVSVLLHAAVVAIIFAARVVVHKSVLTSEILLAIASVAPTAMMRYCMLCRFRECWFHMIL